MAQSNLQELLSVLEEIRAKEYPDIPAEVIAKIVIAQYENQDNRTKARSLTMKTISDFLGTIGAEEVQ